MRAHSYNRQYQSGISPLPKAQPTETQSEKLIAGFGSGTKFFNHRNQAALKPG